jgi:putative ABC transport system substrate-binding protein
MRRRTFIAGLGSTVAWPGLARAQQPAVPVIGFLDWASPRPNAGQIVAFREGLAEAGFIEGRNLAIEYRWANSQLARLPALAAELVSHQVAVIVAVSATSPALAAKGATSTIPIVFECGDDPVKVGLVASLNRPGGNVTGVTSFNTELGGKRFSLLRDLVPQATTVGFLSGNSKYEEQRSQILASALALGRQVIMVETRGDGSSEAAFRTLAEREAKALIVGNFTFRNDKQILALAARYKIPTIYPRRGYVAAGGLMSYGAVNPDIFRQVGQYTGRILKGEKPADLPVMLATKFEFVINLKTAKALGLTIPETLLATADEVIQ